MTDTKTHEYRFKVYSPRWGHDDTYRLTVNQNGWHVEFLAINGDCDKTGHPYLFQNLNQDSIEYPSGLGFEMNLIYEHAWDGTLSVEEIQRRLDKLGEWVGQVDSVPKPSFD